MSLLSTSMLIGCAKKTAPDAGLAECKEQVQTLESELATLKAQQQADKERMAAYMAMLESRKKLDQELRDKLKALIDAGQLRLTYRRGLMLLELPQEVLFDAGKAVLKEDGKAVIVEVSNVLSGVTDRRFLVAGHTDSDPIKARKSTYPSNWELSTARAQSVVNLMVANNFDAANIGVSGFGEFDPTGSNDTAEGKSANRRIEILLIPNLEELMNIEMQAAKEMGQM